ncbi:ABC transporter substrate-binding protein [Nocardioides sp. L-11A]|uniref:ABC transporter substrate-binding protein n=1 Tax=Nocardioides sp. L-11A TaxID=3043848 RepID=UPI00249AAD2D|nr:ABC transporter substrate-binding protein [Nocardioides sp. L-11A]
MSRSPLPLAVIGVLALGSLAACGGSDGGAADGECVVKIGSIFSQTGAASAFGADGERAIELAVKDANAAGFQVDGKDCTIDYKAVDLASDPNKAAGLTQDLITGFGAKFVFGPDMAAAVPPAATAVQRAGDVMMLSVSTGMDAYAGKGDPFFRLSPNDTTMVNDGYIPAAVEQLPDVKDIAMLMTDDDTGKALAEGYAASFENNGVTVSQTEFYDPASTNFAPIVQRIKDGVQGIFIGYNNDSAASAIMDAAAEAGLPQVYLTRGISAQPGVAREDTLDAYTWLVLGADPLYPADDEQKQFIAKFTDAYDIPDGEMTYFPFVHYDYVGMLVQAMEEAGTTTDVEAISEALRGSSYDGVVRLSFDADGLNTSPMGLGVLREGQGEVVSFGGQ